MGPIASEILQQRERLRAACRRPSRVLVGEALRFDLYQDEYLTVTGPYAGAGVDDRDRIFGIPIEYTAEPGRLTMIRVIPDDWESEGQGVE